MKHLCSVNVRAVPKHLRDQFKAYAARRGYTMQAAVQELMRQAVAPCHMKGCCCMWGWWRGAGGVV